MPERREDLVGDGVLRKPSLGDAVVDETNVKFWSESEAENTGFSSFGVVAVAYNKPGFIIGVKVIPNVSRRDLDDAKSKDILQKRADEMWGLTD